jgi:hypothetical protein
MLKTRTRPAAAPALDERTPTGINVAVGAVVIVAAAVAAAFVPSTDPRLRFAVVAFALTSFAVASEDWRAVAALVPLTWLVHDGFLLDRFGVLAWHGWSDVTRGALLVAAALGGLALASARRRIEDRRTRWALGAEVHSLARELAEEKRRG